jgi:MYXO-CTERM domain-containing protein
VRRAIPLPAAALLSALVVASDASAQWTPAGTISSVVLTGGVQPLADGRVLAAGQDAAADVYDPATNTWTPTGPQPQPRYIPVTVLLGDGRVLLAGGLDDETPVASVELYDPATNAWVFGPSMSTIRWRAGGIPLSSGKALVVGGFGASESDVLSSTEVFDGTSWALGPPMLDPRASFSLTLLPTGKALAAGGSNLTGALAASEVFGEDSGWSPVPDMIQPRSGHAASYASDSVLVIGGTAELALITAERFENGEWIASGLLATPRVEASASRLGNGCVLVAGGRNDALEALTSVEIFGADGWADGAPLPTARYLHAATTLADGSVMIVGGTPDGQNVAPDVFVYTLSLPGEACTRDCDCASGACTDGVCCNEACDGPCLTCASGSCEPVATGTDPDDECATEDPTSCGRDGECDGSGACRLHVASTPCGDNGCADATLAAATCNGSGQCVSESVACAPYACSPAGDGCATICESLVDCAEPNLCNAEGKCVPPATNGEPESTDGCSCRAPGRDANHSDIGGVVLAGLALLAAGARRRAAPLRTISQRGGTRR